VLALDWTALAFAAAVLFSALTLMWLLSVRIHNVSIVDIAWAPAFTLFNGSYAWRHWQHEVAVPLRAYLVLAVLMLWGLRLGSHLAVRLIGHAEDARYTAIRRNNDPGFWWKSLGIVFWFQGALVCVVSLVTLAAIGAVTETGWLTWVGVAVATMGVLIEGVADVQLTRWKRLPESAGQVMRSGLWRYSRHPNYFGNFVLWWGLGLTALDVAAWLSLIGPAVMSVLLLRVSGVALLEKNIGERRPKYADYIRTTPAFFPWWPRN